ncbi:hypothetical protein [Streptomyces cyanogenus]|uniref:hypothetical protein n=1 Tax=Streptomyces cyanogenus TaxID=80860 RepID=UPI001AA0CDA7|nr:hypothetical protein [Streptomyces cyanogenus]
MLRTGILRTTTWTHGRRGAVTAASAAVVCLGGVLAACGGGPGDGYTAVGAGAGGPTAVRPSGSVTLVPLDGATPRATSSPGPPESPSGSAGAGGTGSTPTPRTTRSTPTAPGRTANPGTPDPAGSRSGRTTPPAASPGPAESSTTPPATPADLSWGAPATEDTDRRWCQQVTVAFRNAGGTAVRSGSVTFGTHITGALGVDWGTVDSTVELPVPLAPGARRSPTWTVCVDAWRVPLGMHIETRDVSVAWE